ncbi:MULTISPECIES: GNAT family N-acetyltransferase [unclassified Imperialibacter]|uniref:GNAT family N-acetyltransferase n=1 Tax=unclassified Imperialibacter TaxID=2629706 RepID=UPI001255512F|nr:MULTISPECIES: GNAT family N-acetyltransferase [unclassified Imperialibacter]CAD5246349.1 Ribosomal protein S18 acetylase RimI [Imperialibacter sp. 75]CAD5246379.1 Ribosomal protein S18 acetylase RimI [Imperialibacter sp. 89]VVS96130.1 Ribosomal protein S18 acetylase RimI [Imperialibacter sp. EC-SDR9]
MEIKIREGQIEDLAQALELVKELAEYEKALDQVNNSVEQMAVDGFGEHPVFGFFVAEKGATIVGIALYYYRYSTWKGKRIYLEDIVVTQSERGSGIGKQLFDATIQKGKDASCTGMMWQVLDWNEPAINFYKKYGTRFDDGWLNCHLDF